ncbi:MAG: hypothetical protein COT81_05675 [Candidatus Buchananbacteria bacterium CG10_big_fil_rev_8_21_14_0_10_42_9]|uniref:Uncharacterized protein n=1 Tax=Candidatus Buchananbacteria bacterium CG10_big_fil_rev_8_21_14_0_10_42_9 TaxID=1974526 RepID=A0A2H0VZM0_9BACT|nr:MAG: hypothetical protein COT81_05675 [Candidatus Buchananbacteria bacterium CG10_big_fil_rev_8_21_14_0_10_42_9]
MGNTALIRETFYKENRFEISLLDILIPTKLVGFNTSLINLICQGHDKIKTPLTRQGSFQNI